MNHQELAHSIVKKLKQKDIPQSEIYIIKNKSTKIDILNREVESLDKTVDAGLGIRIIKNQRLGFSYSSGFENSSIDETIKRAINNSKVTNPDEFVGLPPPAKTAFKLDIYDKKVAETKIDEKIGLAKRIEEASYQFDKRIKKTEKVSYQDTEYEVFIVNSNGIDLSFKGTNCSSFAQVIAEEGGETEAGMGFGFSLKYDGINPQEIGYEAAERAVELLHAKLISSQKITLVFEPLVSAQFLGVLSGAFSADSVQKGKSAFKNKIGKQVASPILTIIDNGRLEGGFASSPYDDEGVETSETTLIENGTLKKYLYNVYTAKKDSVKSTGNGRRVSFKSIPGVFPSNIYIKPGKTKPEDLIKNVSKGLYVTKVMGMHTANPISGDFSVGAAGILIENGEKKYPVRGITIAGNLIEMLKGVEAVGSDLRFISFGPNLGSPTLCVSGITISGA